MTKAYKFLIVISLLLCSCTVPKNPAPIEYNHYDAFPNANTNPLVRDADEVISNVDATTDKNTFSDDENDEDFVIPAPISSSRSNKKIIYHEVKVGETIEEVAAQYQQSVEVIAALNNLVSPYYLDEFQILKINAISNSSVSGYSDDKNPPALDLSDETPKPFKEKVIKFDYIAPVEGKVISKFGDKTDSGINKGVSIAAKPGTKVLATASGRVIYADYDATFGNLVIIKLDGKNIITSYAHLQEIMLDKGATINQGAVIGYVGNTGKVSQPQLHFGLREGKVAKDPALFIKF